jgi:ABC-type polysaccharide/polyol phosphate export permease
MTEAVDATKMMNQAVDARKSRAARLTPAADDILHGLMSWRLWLRFGWHDLVARFRRSWLGPFWLMATMAVLTLALGGVYSVLFKMPVLEYLPFVALGMVVWSFISAVAGESVQTFVDAEVYLRQVRHSPVTYVFRVVWRNLLVFVNQLVVVLLITAACGALSLRYFPLAMAGIVILVIQAGWVTLLLGVLGARFRDLLPIVQNVLQVMFFVTPVLWPPSALRENSWIADYNPLTHLLAIVRAPFLGEFPNVLSYCVTLIIGIAGYCLAYLVYARFRERIIYWL